MKINKYPFLALLFNFLACQPRVLSRIYVIADDNRFLIQNAEFRGKTIHDTLYSPINKIEAIGDLALDIASHKSELRVGKWTEFYENGRIKAEGEYTMGTYVECCMMGACRQFYNYKKGLWRYWHPNGQLEAEGVYQSVILPINTNCEGGDKGERHRITTNWKFWDENGKAIAPSATLKEKFEDSDYYRFLN